VIADRVSEDKHMTDGAPANVLVFGFEESALRRQRDEEGYNRRGATGSLRNDLPGTGTTRVVS